MNKNSGLQVRCELVPGDHCPADSWRVTLELDGEWVMWREWSEGLNGKDAAIAQQLSRGIGRQIETSVALKH